MRKMTKKKGIIISFICVVIISLFFSAYAVYYRNQVKEALSGDFVYKDVYVFSDEELMEYVVRIKEDEKEALDHIPVTLETKVHEYATVGLKNSLIFLFIIILITVITVFVIWKIVNQIYLNRLSAIATRIMGSDREYDVESIEEIMLMMKKDLKRNENDYRRLHSYLAHEQKNALSIIRSKTELQGDNKILKDLDKISDSIDDLLTLSEDAYQVVMENNELAVIAAKAVDEYSKYQEIEFTFEELDDTTVLGEERWLYRAISNLLDNAIKYGNNKPVTVNVRCDKNDIIISVSDQGIGIEEEQRSIIFQNRYRINELNKNGYGIGLSLVKHVCELCNGFVWVSSTPDVGSTFYMSFPKVYKEGKLNE